MQMSTKKGKRIKRLFLKKKEVEIHAHCHMGPGEVKKRQKGEKMFFFTISQSKNGRWILSFRGRRMLAHFEFGVICCCRRSKISSVPFLFPNKK
jgi:hypothetical protein